MKTPKNVLEALRAIADYAEQLRFSRIPPRPCEIGCRVGWLESSRKEFREHKKHGTVIAYNPWFYNPDTDGIATVKWDGIATPETMHVSHLVAVIPAP